MSCGVLSQKEFAGAWKEIHHDRYDLSGMTVSNINQCFWGIPQWTLNCGPGWEQKPTELDELGQHWPLEGDVLLRIK